MPLEPLASLEPLRARGYEDGLGCKVGAYGIGLPSLELLEPLEFLGPLASLEPLEPLGAWGYEDGLGYEVCGLGYWVLVS